MADYIELDDLACALTGALNEWQPVGAQLELAIRNFADGTCRHVAPAQDGVVDRARVLTSLAAVTLDPDASDAALFDRVARCLWPDAAAGAQLVACSAEDATRALEQICDCMYYFGWRWPYPVFARLVDALASTGHNLARPRARSYTGEQHEAIIVAVHPRRERIAVIVHAATPA